MPNQLLQQVQQPSMQQQFFQSLADFQPTQSVPMPAGMVPNVAAHAPSLAFTLDVPVETVADKPSGKAKNKKSSVCWKCSVNTHATKDCTAQHYCLVRDNTEHPTLRCPLS